MRSTATNLGGFVAGEQVEPVTRNSNGNMTQTIIVTPAKPSSSPCRQKHQADRLPRQQLLEPRGRKSKRNLAADKPFRFDVARLEQVALRGSRFVWGIKPATEIPRSLQWRQVLQSPKDRKACEPEVNVPGEISGSDRY
jgi:hypothetical protein